MSALYHLSFTFGRYKFSSLSWPVAFTKKISKNKSKAVVSILVVLIIVFVFRFLKNPFRIKGNALKEDEGKNR